MTSKMIEALVRLEAHIEHEQKELCLLVIELAKEVMTLREEMMRLRNSPEMLQARLLVPIGGSRNI